MDGINLNERQREAAENLADNILMLAPAGTGKTNTLSVRISNIIEQGKAAPEEILCLTFTNRACKEMQQRVERTVGEPGFGVTVRTVHSFGYMLLREFAKLTGNDATGICDEEDSLEYIAEILAASYPVKDAERLKTTAAKLAALFEMAKHRMYRENTTDIPSTVSAVIYSENVREKLCSDGDATQNEAMLRFMLREAGKVMEAYRKRLAEQRLWDFHDLVLGMGILRYNKTIREQLKNRYKYVHIDEVQDISDVEYDILTRMFPSAVFLLCGDANQTIYEWRGSVPGVILPRFKRERNAVEISLSENYRSTPGLVNLGERFLRNTLAPGIPPAKLYTEDDAEIRAFDTEADQTKWLYETIKALDVGGDYSRAAVLCRSNYQCERLSREFQRLNREEGSAGLSFMLVEEFKIFRAKEIKDILALMSLALYPDSAAALKRVGEAYLGFSRGELESLPLYNYAVAEAALKDGNAVVFDVESTGVNVFEDEIIQAAAIRIGEKGRLIESFMQFIKPNRPVGDSEKTHRISDAFLREHGRTSLDVLKQLSEFLNGKVIIGHNVRYDLEILATELWRNALPPIEPLAVCDTLELARSVLPDLENHRLETLANQLEIECKPTHDAMDDIMATAQVLIKLLEKSPGGQLAGLLKSPAESLAGLRGAARSLSSGELCDYIARRFKLREKYADEPARLANIDMFTRFMEEDVFNRGWYRRDIATVLEYSSLSGSEFNRLSKAAKKLLIITVHQSKGCEFEYVFLPNMNKYSFPGYRSEISGAKTEEARLFYVAVTRAQRKLFLSWYKKEAGRDRPREKSEFLDRL